MKLADAPHCDADTFPVATISNGKVGHYIDDYRYKPGRTICGRMLEPERYAFVQTEVPLCKRCVQRGPNYPTHAEWLDYMRCTDCGEARHDEVSYQLRPSIWELAYPGYNDGVGVGESRPCIGCLEKRLGRRLTLSDFTRGQTPQPEFSDRLNDRLRDTM